MDEHWRQIERAVDADPMNLDLLRQLTQAHERQSPRGSSLESYFYELLNGDERFGRELIEETYEDLGRAWIFPLGQCLSRIRSKTGRKRCSHVIRVLGGRVKPLFPALLSLIVDEIDWFPRLVSMLGRVGKGDRWCLEQSLKTAKSPLVRVRLLLAISLSGYPDLVDELAPTLKSLLRDPVFEVRASALQTVSRFSKTPGCQQFFPELANFERLSLEEAMDLLRPRLQSEDVNVAKFARVVGKATKYLCRMQDSLLDKLEKTVLGED